MVEKRLSVIGATGNESKHGAPLLALNVRDLNYNIGCYTPDMAIGHLEMHE